MRNLSSVAVNVGKWELSYYLPCFSIDGDVGTTTLQNAEFRDHSPTLFAIPLIYCYGPEMQLKPAEQWGSCETPQGDGGYS